MPSLSKSESISSDEDILELRRGPWTVEEDNLLIRYIACHGEGRWNKLAKCSGLKRNGKSCRLRWLNYLKPDVKRGNLAPQEQLLILELHSKWGNRWSKIAQHLPGRTDNEIKNYWRTRVQKQARYLKIDSTSAKFQEMIRCLWMPLLLQKIQGSPSTTTNHQLLNHSSAQVEAQVRPSFYNNHGNSSSSEPLISTDCSSDGSMHIPQLPQLSEYPISPSPMNDFNALVNMEKFIDPMGDIDTWVHDEVEDSSWNMEDLWELQEWQN